MTFNNLAYFLISHSLDDDTTVAHSNTMDDIQGNGNVEVDLNNDDDDDDMFKSARGLEPEPAKREVNLFGEVDDEPINTLPGNSSPDMMDKEIPLEDEDEKPFEVRINITLRQLQIFIFSMQVLFYTTFILLVTHAITLRISFIQR